MAQVFSFRIPQALHFGSGVYRQLPALVRARATGRILLLTDPGVAAAGIAPRVAETLAAAGCAVERYEHISPEPHLDEVERCRSFAARQDIAAVVGVGGGSVLDAAKIVSGFAACAQPLGDFVDRESNGFGPGLPLFLLPTTAGSGAEATAGAIVTHDNRKSRLVGRYAEPTAVLVDPTFTRSLPAGVTLASGLDALTHAIESYAARRASPMSRLYSREAFRLCLSFLPRVIENGDDMRARGKMAQAALYAGIAVANAGAGAVHALAYPLAGRAPIAHGIGNAILLPHVLERNVAASPDAYAGLLEEDGTPLETPCGSGALLDSLRGFLATLQTPARLSDFGISARDVPALAAEAYGIRRLLDNNARRFGVSEIEALFRAAL